MVYRSTAEVEALSGQRAIAYEDFLKIPFVVSRPTSIDNGGEYNGKPCFVFKRDGLSVVGVVSDKHLDLFVQTMYASKKIEALPLCQVMITSSRKRPKRLVVQLL